MENLYKKKILVQFYVLSLNLIFLLKFFVFLKKINLAFYGMPIN